MFRLALEVAPNAMLLVREEGTIVMANQAAGELFRYPPSELVGRPIEDLVPSTLREAHRQQRADFAENPKTRPMGQKRDLRAVTRDGSELLVEVGLSPVQTRAGMMVICAVVDLSARKETEAELARAAALLGEKNEELMEMVVTDGLTGLKSRRAFLDHLSAQIEVSVRHARPFSVLILDIDHFKRYNDDFGHLAGDEVLRQMGTVLREVARRSDFVARLGGEEFGILLPETERAGATVLGERFREVIESANWPRRPVTASIGVMTVEFEQAVPRPQAPEPSFILREADRALYRAKELGRNRVVHAGSFSSEEGG